MKMFFDPLSHSTFSYDQLRRLIKMLSVDETPSSLIRFIKGLKEVEVPDDENKI